MKNISKLWCFQLRIQYGRNSGLETRPSDPVMYPPPTPGVFLYYTERIYLFFSVIDRPYLFDDWCCAFLSQVVQERHFWMFVFGDRFLFSFGRSVSDCIKTNLASFDSHPHVVAHNTSEAPLRFPTLPLPVFFSTRPICFF